ELVKRLFLYQAFPLLNSNFPNIKMSYDKGENFMDFNGISILNNITGASYSKSAVDISKTLGNVLLTGGNGKGRITFLQNVLYQSLINHNIPILIITNKQSSFSKNVDYLKFCQLLKKHKRIWNFDMTNSENADYLNPFKEMNHFA